MTFIASVIAQKGVAIIADSLVTSVASILHKENFIDYVKDKNKDSKDDDEINIEFAEVYKMFESKPSFTKDYQEKLFKYDNYTAIAIAGAAYINEKNVGDIITDLSEYNQHTSRRRSYNAKKPETKVKDFIKKITDEIREHLKKRHSISETTFIYTHYNKTNHKTIVYKIEVLKSTKKNLDDPAYEFVSYSLEDPDFKVVCDGQNRLTERILFGNREALMTFVPKIVTAVTGHFNITDKMIAEKAKDEEAGYFIKVVKECGILNKSFYEDLKINQLSNLSLQQAVDLACLLMKLETDFQKYTKNIPTVGGVIKLATIDGTGFKWISGDSILKPDYI